MVTSIGRVGFDKVKTKGREAAPFEVRYQNGKGPESLRADAVIDATARGSRPIQPALMAAGDREHEVQDRLAYGMPDVLGRERARYVGRRSRAGGRPLRHRYLDRSRAAEGRSADHSGHLVVRGDNRRRPSAAAPRQARGTRRTGCGFRQARRQRQDPRRGGLQVSHLSRDGARLRISTGAPVAAAMPSLTSWWSPRPSARPRFLREVRLSLDPALECPPELAP